MSGLFESIFGGGKKEADTSQGEETITTDENKAKAIRSALYSTEGGSVGAELTSGQTKKRDTLLGN